jgi:WD repeat-containing protein 55
LVCIDASKVCTFSASSAKESIVWRIESASVGSSANGRSSPHNPLHVLHQLPDCCSKGSLLVTGDDRGGVRLWDERLCDTAPQNTQPGNNSGPLQLPQGCVLSWKENKDYISALDHSEDGNTLLATSADGCLSVFDIRQASTSRSVQNPSVARRSDPQDDELLSMVIMKNGKKIVAGTQDGVLAIWSWGTWGDISDRYPLLQNNHSSLDTLLKVDEDTLLTGSSDGLVRVVTVHPNKVLGALGDHDGFPIETLAFNANRSWVGSISHDPYIRLWDAGLFNDEGDDDSDEGKMEHKDSKPSARRMPVPVAATTNGGQASDDEWEDMDEDDDEAMEEDKDDMDSDDSDGDSDSDDDNRPTTNENRANRLKTKNEDFFADL